MLLWIASSYYVLSNASVTKSAFEMLAKFTPGKIEFRRAYFSKKQMKYIFGLIDYEDSHAEKSIVDVLR